MSYFLTWLALLALLAATTASSLVPLGPWNSVINFGIAAAKAFLVAMVFMELRRAGALIRLVALVGLLMLGLLFGLSWTDYSTRNTASAPWVAPTE